MFLVCICSHRRLLTTSTVSTLVVCERLLWFNPLSTRTMQSASLFAESGMKQRRNTLHLPSPIPLSDSFFVPEVHCCVCDVLGQSAIKQQRLNSSDKVKTVFLMQKFVLVRQIHGKRASAVINYEASAHGAFSSIGQQTNENHAIIHQPRQSKAIFSAKRNH